MTLEELLDRLGTELEKSGSPVPHAERVVEALREMTGRQSQRLGEIEAELRRELDRKQEIKSAVTQEVTRLESQLGETRVHLSHKEDDHRKLKEDRQRLEESLQDRERTLRSLEEELRAAREKAAELEVVRARLEERDRRVRELEVERGGVLATTRVMEDARNAALKKADEEERARAEVQEKLVKSETKIRTLAEREAEAHALKARVTEFRERVDKERKDLQDRLASVQAEIAAKDHKIRDLQVLVKTLGERLNAVTGLGRQR